MCKTEKTNFAMSQFWEAKKEVDNAWLNFNFVDNKDVESAIYRLIAAEIDFNQMCCRVKRK